MTTPRNAPVIPVMDLLNGVVVQAVRGLRDRYKPVTSILASGADPLAIASALQAETASDALYIADLDAILNGRGNWDTLAALAQALPCRLWVDAGVANVDEARHVLDNGADQVVVSTEGVPSLDGLTTIGRALDPNRVLMSLVVLRGVVLAKDPDLTGQAPLDGLMRLADMGFSRFILLTLDGVGTGGGPDWGLLAPARRRLPQATLLAGGGVRGMEDISRAAALGLDGVLVATALHRGWISASDLRPRA